MNEQNIQKPENYLVWSILATLMCCLPLGIAAIIYSTKVDSAWNAGRYEEAVKASEQTKQFLLFSVIGGVIIFAISFVCGFISAL